MTTRLPRHYYKQNRMQQLRGFCYAVQTGSISRAAERMFLSQPSVSLQVQALERELQTTLFERRGPRIKLTPDGETLYELALPLVESIDGLAESFAARKGNVETGEINVAAGESTILYLLPDIMKRFAADYPGIRLRFHNVPGREGLRLLRADDVDFAVGAISEVPDDIHYRPLYSFDEMLITAPDHPLAQSKALTLEQISHYGFILPPRHLNTLDMVALAFRQRGLDIDVRIEAGGWEVIKHCVMLGIGISIVSGICVSRGDNLAHHSLAEYFPPRSYGLVMRKGKFLSPQAQQFIDHLCPQAGAEPTACAAKIPASDQGQ